MSISEDMVERAAQALFDRECARAKMRGQIMHHPAGQRVASMVASYRDDYFADAREMLTAALQGSVVVPEEPTPAMLGAWYQYKSGWHPKGTPAPPDTSDYGAYRAMLAAAPSVSRQNGGGA